MGSADSPFYDLCLFFNSIYEDTDIYISPDKDTQQQAHNYIDTPKEESPRFSQMIASNVKVIYNHIEERIINMHSKVLGATGLGERREYKVTSKICSATARKATSSLKQAASSLDAITGCIITSTMDKATEIVDNTFETVKTKFNSVKETFERSDISM